MVPSGTINQKLLVAISLCNVVLIITKTIANRLKLVLLYIICDTRSNFVLRRLITDNALIAFECFHYMKKKITSRMTLSWICQKHMTRLNDIL